MYKQVNETIQLIKEAGGIVETVITDGNRTNQKIFKLFPTIPGKPWLTTDGIFLLFDYVHILKSIRNNWLTECKEKMNYLDDDGKWKTAKWKHLIRCAAA